MELLGGGMPGKSGDKNGDTGTLPALIYTGNCGSSGGGKLPPPMVHLMRHARPPAGTERQAPYHSSVRQGSGAEEAELRESL